MKLTLLDLVKQARLTAPYVTTDHKMSLPCGTLVFVNARWGYNEAPGQWGVIVDRPISRDNSIGYYVYTQDGIKKYWNLADDLTVYSWADAFTAHGYTLQQALEAAYTEIELSGMSKLNTDRLNSVLKLMAVYSGKIDIVILYPGG